MTLANIRSLKVNGDNQVIMYGNQSLTNLVFNDVATVKTYSFAFVQDQSKEAKVTFIGNTHPLTIQGDAFVFNFAIKELALPKNTISIGRSAFAMCEGLAKITLPNREIEMNVNFNNSSRGNFTTLFRRCPITQVMFRGNLSDWANNATYKQVFGEVSDPTPDANGGYTLSYSAYAQSIHEHFNDPYFTSPIPEDYFANNSRDGLIKLYLISE